MNVVYFGIYTQAGVTTFYATIVPPPPPFSHRIVVSCDCISIKYKKLEQLIPHCCIKVTAPERNSRDDGKKHDEFLYKAN